MGTIVILIFTALLVLVSGFIVLIVLMQRPSANSGMGSALGGGAAESAFGAQTGNVLTRATIIGCVTFFLLAFSLYLGYMANLDEVEERSSKLSEMLSVQTDEDSASDITALVEQSLTDIDRSALIKAEVEAATNAAEGEADSLGIQLDGGFLETLDGNTKEVPAVEEEPQSK